MTEIFFSKLNPISPGPGQGNIIKIFSSVLRKYKVEAVVIENTINKVLLPTEVAHLDTGLGSNPYKRI